MGFHVESQGDSLKLVCKVSQQVPGVREGELRSAAQDQRSEALRERSSYAETTYPGVS